MTPPDDTHHDDLDALEAAIARVADAPLADLRGDQLTARVLRIDQLRTRLEAACLTGLREVEATAAWAIVDPAAVNAKGWLANHTGQSRAVAGSRVALARKLARMPATAAALADGSITDSHARVLAGCVKARTAARFEVDEHRLVDLARTHTADELAVLARHWLLAADPDGNPPDDGTHDEVHLSKTLDRWMLKGSFGDTIGAELAAALRDKCDELFRRERDLADTDPTDPIIGRSPAARRAAALAELVGLGAASPGSGIHRRPSVTVHVDHHTFVDVLARHQRADGGLADGPLTDPDEAWDPHGRLCDTGDGTVVSPDLLRLWLCDADICRAVIGAHGEILDLGRATRTATPAQRKALAARDRGCVIPGCDRPPSWCDAHHVTWWHEGGATDIPNLALVCRHHHTRIHQGHLRIRIHHGKPVVTNGAGTPLHHPRRPPPQPPPPPGGDPPGGDPPTFDELFRRGQPIPEAPGWHLTRFVLTPDGRAVTTA